MLTTGIDATAVTSIRPY